ncbi:hypothetical protein [Spongiactinospora sp. TRM90649]|uniref:hypothetical protein n=1 Tax=Spongiactinospora sp. TRM90649 TaxID=3031114 RepID=UPI0023F844FF|nr:hypothetical protein [Spongiactinospora sp. TRM90649]MDF5751176.1 hypothetical protein [Spongiactinospora sp. TRM90649]
MYRVDAHPTASEQIDALPTHALVPLMELWTALGVAPWGFPPYNQAKQDGPMRMTIFGDHKQGYAVFLILEEQRRVEILRLVWVD